MDAKLVEESVDKFVDTVNTVISRTSTIILANGFDLMEMDMSKYSPFTFFISDMTLERGTAKIVKDPELKKELFKFCTEHEDREFRGTNGEKNGED